MNDMISHLLCMKAQTKGYWAERIVAELEYATKLSRVMGRKHDALLRAAIESLFSQHAGAGAITRETVEETEAKLQGLSADAKSFTLLCASHAHIDMNWLWRFDETVAIALDTFRTVLALMGEYPAFTFSQSQASVYRMVEEHDPEMMREIKKRVKEGRWEVTASTWVEADKNMPSGESLSRHALYARRYLSRLLEIPAESLMLDFEPDTFGHSRNVPEILARAGVRWYYHCRGYEDHNLYRWQAPSGAEVIAYRDPFWYNATVSPEMALFVPEFCRKHGMDTMLRVYGIGDHGGGPTRRDIERLIDMDAWPLFPRVRFGAFHEYFKLVEKIADRLPVVNKELNFVFTGCYTTQTRIKAANRTLEARLGDAETLASLASLATASHSRAEALAKAWETALFNHFHDILPGSGIVDTREYALGQFQRAMAAAGAEASLALRRMAANVDSSGSGDPKEDARSSMSEGAGVGYGVESFRLSLVGRGRGRTRVFHVFNPLPRPRKEIAELVVWDWEGNPGRLLVRDAAGETIPHQVIPNEMHPFFGVQYWGHQYMRVLVQVAVPACGYSTCTLTEATPTDLPVALPADPRVEKPDSHTLENELLRAVFDSRTAALVSLVDKETGEEMVDGKRPAGVFRLVREDDAKGMTAWIVGRWMSVASVHENVKMTPVTSTSGGLRQSLSYEMCFEHSLLKATVSLDRGSACLAWNVECEWLEKGRKGEGIPQLNFFLPLSGECKAYRYDVPFGVVDRQAADMDLPANSWALGVPRKAGRKAVMLQAGQKHAFRCIDDSLSLTLIRSSFDPDPHPELGIHRFSFGVSLLDCGSNRALVEASQEAAHPLIVLSTAPHAGTLPPAHGFLSLDDGTVAVSAVKQAEDSQGGRRLVVRLYETDGKKTTATLSFFRAPAAAWLADLNENRLSGSSSIRLDGKTVSLDVEACTVVTLIVDFEAGKA